MTDFVYIPRIRTFSQSEFLVLYLIDLEKIFSREPQSLLLCNEVYRRLLKRVCSQWSQTLIYWPLFNLEECEIRVKKGYLFKGPGFILG